MKVRIRSKADDFEAHKFEGNMFSAVDIVRAICPGRESDASYHGPTALLSIYDPVADRTIELSWHDWLVKAPGGALYRIEDGTFQLFFELVHE